MLGLRTFGAVYVSDADGSPRDGAAGQRRLLALLAVLAAGDEAGVSRDRVLALLWPDANPEKARHALTQTLYHTRKAVQCDDLFVLAGADLRLNAERITTDVGAFRRFMSADAFEQAVSSYRGPFLDGFHLTGSGEFEHWVSAERSRAERQVVQALDQLAARAESAGNAPRAIDLRTRLQSIDPLSSAATHKLMSAHAVAGDRASALQVAKVHAALVRDQLEVEPDRSIVELTAKLKAAPVATPSAVRVAHPLPAAEEPSPVLAVDQGARAIAPSAPPRRSRRLAVAIAATILALAVSIGGVVLTRHAGASRAVASSVLVAPFRVSGADRAFGYLSEGMVELLSARLADDSGAHAVDPGVVLNAWRTRATGPTEISRERGLEIARRLGASRLVVGSVVGGATRLVLSASLLVVPSGEVDAQATVEGPPDSVTAIVDRVAVKLLAVSAGEGDRLSHRTTPSLVALRAFLSGQSAYRRGDYNAAIPLYERALAADSTFALAALQLAMTADQVNDNEQHDRALAIAWANRGDLSARDDAHLIAFAGPRYPSPSTESEQLAAWERAVVLASDRADVWVELGERFFRAGAVVGVENSHDRARAALMRALELDSAQARARRVLIMLAARHGDTALLTRIATASVLHDSLDPLAPFLRWRVALVRGDDAELRRIRALLPTLSDESIRAMAMAALNDSVGVEDGNRASRIRDARTRRAGAEIDALLERHAFALNEGRPALALAITGQIEERQPGSRTHLRLRVLDALYSNGDRAAGEAAAKALGRVADGARPRDADAYALQLADLCVVEQWRIARGTTSSARRAIARLRAAALPRTPVPVSANQLTCAAILDAALSVTTKQRDALARVVALDSLMLSGPAVSDAATYANIAVSRMYERLGKPRAALDVLRRRTYMTGWPRYLGTMRSEEARLAASIDEQ